MNPGIAMLLVFLVAAVYAVVANKRERYKRMVKTIRRCQTKPANRVYTKEELDCISHYYADCVDGCIPCSEKDYIDDYTWDDLGMDKIYARINTCLSSVGQEVLYKLLRMPANDVDKLSEYDRLIRQLREDEDNRFRLSELFYKQGYVKRIAISDYIGLIGDQKPEGNIIAKLVLAGLAIAVIVIGTGRVDIGVGLLIATAIASVISYYPYKAKVEPFFICVKQIILMMNTAERIVKLNIDYLTDYNKELKEIITRLKAVKKGAWLLQSANQSGSIVEIFMDYIRLITHIDLIKYNHSIRVLKGKINDVYRLYELLGLIDSLIAVGSYRATLKSWCVPSLSADKVDMSVANVYHPLIEDAVCNSITATRAVLLTGSNASGKSTFLKTIAINALLSQSIYTSPSESYNGGIYKIYSSMSLRDDLAAKESYYIVEIKALKRILDAIDVNDKPVLCFIDEVLRGTNTVERIAASSNILKSLKGRNVLCFAATHDIELTTMLSDCFDNYHFQEEIKDDIVFNYKLFKGAATTRNAIKLLKMIGYESSIVESSERTANRFLNEGIWQL